MKQIARSTSDNSDHDKYVVINHELVQMRVDLEIIPIFKSDFQQLIATDATTKDGQ